MTCHIFFLDRLHNHYPVLNVTAESDYNYFVDQFNFVDAPSGQFFIGAEYENTYTLCLYNMHHLLCLNSRDGVEYYGTCT